MMNYAHHVPIGPLFHTWKAALKIGVDLNPFISGYSTDIDGKIGSCIEDGNGQGALEKSRMSL